MKKLSVIAAQVGVVLIGGLGISQAVSAATDETKASVTVNPGALTIKSNEDIAFDALTITGKDNKDYGEKGASKVTIEDLRGSDNKGWQLKVKTKDKGFSAGGIDLKFNPKNDTKYATSGDANLSINDQQALVAWVEDDKIKDTEIETAIQLGAKLDIPAKTKAKAYATTLVWSLEQTPETK